MAHSIEWARRLLQELPGDPQELLPAPGRRRNYADPTFLGLFLDWLDERIFHDPQAGLRWAKVAPELARVTPAEEGPEGKRAQREDLVKAHVILGGAYRAAGRPDAAEKPYQDALRIAGSDAISPAVRAFLNQRLAVLRACQGRPRDALRLLDETLEIHPEPGLERSNTLVPRGYVLNDLGRCSEAVECLGEAFQGIQPETSAAAARTHQCAVHNLVLAITKWRQAPPWQALGHVREAKRLLGDQRRSMPRHRLQWVEGLVLRRLDACGARAGYSLVERAETAFLRAREGFIQLGAPWEIALVGLELAALYRSLGRWDDLFAIAFDTLQRFRRLSGNTQAVAALSLCVDAAQARSGAAAAIAAAQEIVANRAARSPSPAKLPARANRPRPSTGAPRTPVPPGRRRDAARTRDALLKAAFEEIHRNGFGSPRNVRRILSSVGVTKGAIKHHFGSAQELGYAVVDELARERMLADWVRPVDEADNPLDAIRAALQGALEEAPLGPLNNLARGLDKEGFPQGGRTKTPRDRVEELYGLWRRSLARNLARGQRQGTVRDDVDPEAAAACLIAFYEGSIGLARGSRDPQLLEICGREILRYLDALRPQ